MQNIRSIPDKLVTHLFAIKEIVRAFDLAKIRTGIKLDVTFWVKLLSASTAIITNRYGEPEERTRLGREMGAHAVMFNIDLIGPSWPWDPWDLQRHIADITLEACPKNGIRIVSSFDGHHGHQHYLGHPNQQCGREAETFSRRAIRQTPHLGGKSFGTWILSRTITNSDPTLRGAIIADALKAYRRLDDYGAEMELGR